MNRSQAWNIAGVGRETREVASEAARRAGMSLGEWLDQVVADKANAEGLDPKDYDADDRLEAISERLGRLSRDDDARAARRREMTSAPRPDAPTDAENIGKAREASRVGAARRDSDPAEALLDAAVERFEGRIARAEERSARAFESVAQFLKRSESERRDERETLRNVADRLEAIDHRVTTAPKLGLDAPQRDPDWRADPSRTFDERMSDLARRAEASGRARRDAPISPERPRTDLKEALARIARRRQELDARDANDSAPPSASAPGKSGWRNFGVDNSNASRPQPPETKIDAADLSGLRGQIAQLGRLLDDIRREQAERVRTASPEIADVRAEIAALSRTLVDSAPNKEVDGQGVRDAIQLVAQKLEDLRKAQSEQRSVTSSDIGALRAQIVGMNQSLADLAPRNAVVALEGAIRDLGQRIATLRDDGQSEAFLAPLERLADDLRASLRAHDPQRIAVGLSRELQALGDRIDRIAQNAIDPEAFERIRKQTEEVRNLLATAAMRPVPVERLERQIGELADRVERLSANPAPHTELAALTAQLSDLRDQVERSTAVPALLSIEKNIERLSARFDEELRRPQSSPTIDPKLLEGIAQRIDGLRQSLESRLQAPFDSSGVETALKEISAKLERSSGGSERGDLQLMLQELGARIDRRPAPVIDTKPIEVALRNIGSRPVAVDMAPLETLMRGIDAKLAQPAPIDTRPIEAMLRELEAKIGSVRSPAFDAAGIEPVLREIKERLDRVPTASVDGVAIEALMRDLNAKLSQPAPIDTRPIEKILREFDAKLVSSGGSRIEASGVESLLREIKDRLDAAPQAGVDAKALEASLRELGARIDRSAATPIDTQPIERMLKEFDAKLAALSAPANNAGAAPGLLQEISAKLDRAATAGPDVRALEAALHDLSARVERNAPTPIDTRPIERMLATFDAKLDAIGATSANTRSMDSLLREVNDKLDRALSGGVDAEVVAGLLHDIGARLDERLSNPVDTRPIENSLRALHAKLDSGVTPAIDPELIEHAVELLARRLDQRAAGHVDPNALAGQIALIHERIESLSTGGPVARSLERVVQDLLKELEATRAVVEGSRDQNSREANPNLASDLADLRALQSGADKRMQARLSGVQDILEKLVTRLGRIEDEIAGEADEEDAGAQDARFAPKAALDAVAPAMARPEDSRIRDIPNFAPPRAAAASSASGAPVKGAKAVAADDALPSLDGSDFLLEPGAGAPSRNREAPPEEGSGAKPAAINAHIAAARRAAQAALAESAAQTSKETAGAPKAKNARAALGVGQAKSFLAARRRPVLLGAALVAIVAMLALGPGGKLLRFHRSEPTPPKAQVGAVDSSIDLTRSVAPAPALVDSQTVGTIATPPAPPATIKLEPAVPAALTAAIPEAVSAPLREAVAAGAAGAQYELAQRLLEGRGLARDPQVAAQWFEQAASRGLAPAQYRLAALYEKGVGVARDAAAAKSWYLKAASAGNVRAMHNLAVMSAETAGAKPDYTEAVNWFRKAAQFGVRDSQYNLGILYGRGLGVQQDLAQSWMWFSLATQQGDSDAAKKRDEVAAKMDATALAAAKTALAGFKADKPEPIANEVASPPGGWDAKLTAPQAGPASPPASSPSVKPQASL